MKAAEVFKSIGKLLIAPFIGLLYASILPFVFIYAIGKVFMDGAFKLSSSAMSFGWRPIEAYFAGKKRGKKEETLKAEKEENK